MNTNTSRNAPAATSIGLLGPFGGGHGAVGGDPGGIGFADLGQRRRARLVGGGQQLEDFGPLGLGHCPGGRLQVGDQAAQQVGQLGIAPGVRQLPRLPAPWSAGC